MLRECGVLAAVLPDIPGDHGDRYMEHILSLSYGKDSLACLGAIEQLGWPLDRIVHVVLTNDGDAGGAERWQGKLNMFPKMS